MSHPSPSSPEPLRPASGWSGRTVAVLVGLTLLAAGLRGSHVGARDFWFDESCTYVHVHDLFRADSPPLPLSERPLAAYYGLVWAWTRLFGESEVGYRSLSVVASVLTVPVMGWAARSIGGSTVGWICALLAALNPLSVYYAREARPYACWTLLLSISFALLLLAVERNRRRDWALFGFALLLTLHFHAFTLWWAPCSVAVVVLGSDRRAALRRWIVAMLVVGAAYLPMLLVVVVPVASLGSNAWIGDAPGTLAPIVRTLSAFLPAGEYPGHLRGLSLESPDTVPFFPEWVSSVESFVVIATIVVLMGLSLRIGRRNRWEHESGGQSSDAAGNPFKEPSPLPLSLGGRGVTETDSTPVRSERPSPNPSHVHAVLAALTLGPLLLMQIYAWIGRPCYIVGRYDLVAWPAFMVWISLGVSGGARWHVQARRSRAPACSPTAWRRFAWTSHPRNGLPWSAILGAVVLLLAACSLDPLLRMNGTPPGPSFARARAERLARLAGPADLVVTFSYDRAYLAYYLYRSGFSARVRSFPVSLDQHIGWVDTLADLSRDATAAFAQDAGDCVNAIKEVHVRGGTAWFLLDSLDPLDQGAREPIHRVLRSALRSSGYRVRPIDEPLLIGRVESATP